MLDGTKSREGVKLTAAGLKAITITPETGTVWDADLAGFGLRVRGRTDPGSWRWVYSYRHKARGTQVKLTLGSPLTYAPDEARRWAKDAAKKANTSDDAFDAKDRERRAHAEEKAKPTVRELWREWRDAEGLAKKDARNDLYRWTTYLEPAFGKMKVAEVTPRDVNKFKEKHADKPVSVNRCISVLSVMFTFAVAHQYRRGCAPEHPIKGRVVRRNREVPVDFHFSPEELGRILEAADADANKAAGLAIRMLALTGARMSEVTRAHWDQFEKRADGRLIWTVERTNTKTGKPYSRTLDADLSRRLLEWRHLSLAWQKVVQLEPGAKDRPLWVFPQTGHSRNSSPSKPMWRIFHVWGRVKKAAGVQRGRIHDLRHTAATVIVKETGSLEAAKRQLGHATILTTQRYAHHAPEMAERSSDILASHAKTAVEKAQALAEGAPVIPLRITS